MKRLLLVIALTGLTVNCVPLLLPFLHHHCEHQHIDCVPPVVEPPCCDEDEEDDE